jgi:hypothetical protein
MATSCKVIKAEKEEKGQHGWDRCHGKRSPFHYLSLKSLLKGIYAQRLMHNWSREQHLSLENRYPSEWRQLHAKRLTRLRHAWHNALT